jgi:hypothetical protein
MRGADIRDRLAVHPAFGAHVDLRGITCDGPLDLDGLHLPGLDLTGSTFPDGISARGAVFHGLSWLRDLRSANLDFTGALFLSDARFDGLICAGNAIFDAAEFRGVTQFDAAEVAGDVGLRAAVGYGNFALQGADLQGITRMTGSEWFGGLWLEDTRFAALEAGDMLVHGRLWLRRARLAGQPVPPEAFDISFGYCYR